MRALSHKATCQTRFQTGMFPRCCQGVLPSCSTRPKPGTTLGNAVVYEIQALHQPLHQLQLMYHAKFQAKFQASALPSCYQAVLPSCYTRPKPGTTLGNDVVYAVAVFLRMILMTGYNRLIGSHQILSMTIPSFPEKNTTILTSLSIVMRLSSE